MAHAQAAMSEPLSSVPRSEHLTTASGWGAANTPDPTIDDVWDDERRDSELAADLFKHGMSL